MPGSKAVFLEHFRGYNFGAVAAVVDWTVLHGIHLRSEIHLFKATEGIVSCAIKDPVWIQLFPRFGWEAYTLGKNCQLDPSPLELNITKVSALPCFSKCFSGTDCSKGVHDDKVGLS